MKYQYNNHIMAFGPHPDDIEVGCGGVLWQANKDHKTCIVIDCTTSQYSTRGDDITRLAESQQAGSILGVSERINL